MSEPNVLYYGDNLDVLRKHVGSETVDLVYLDPPFNSSRSYNLIFRPTGKVPEGDVAQSQAFEDSWHWGDEAESAYKFLTSTAQHQGRVPTDLSVMIDALVRALDRSDMTAYLVMMAIRLVELRRVLKHTGSLYLHCDPSASHYLKCILDATFGPTVFRSEIIWKRTSAHSSSLRYGPVHDVLLFYSKSDDYTWNPLYQPYDQHYLDEFYTHVDPDGRRWRRSDLTGAGVRHGATGEKWRGLDVTAKGWHWAYPPDELEIMDAAKQVHWPKREGGMPMFKRYIDTMPGVPMQDVWTDIPPMHNLSAERLGYPTQKPLALLERIILASSNPGDLILDPFCGCGTAVVAAQKLDRRWIGIDVTHLAIAVMRSRLIEHFPGLDPMVIGEPTSLAGAIELAQNVKGGRYQFQWWALSKIHAMPIGGTKKEGSDHGKDGLISFDDGATGMQSVIVSVKSGHVDVTQIRDLKGVLTRDKAAMGIFLTLEEPTAPMRKEAVSAGFFTSTLWQRDYPTIQLMTIAEILDGRQPELPPITSPYQRAGRVSRDEQAQLPL